MQEPLRLTYGELMPYIIAGNIVFGVLFGSFPLIFGFIAGNRKYAFLGFVCSIIGGAILGIVLSYPLALIFLWLILRRKSASLPVESQDSAVSDETTSS